MYLILSKEDFEKRTVESKEPQTPDYPHHTLRVMELGSLRVKRYTDRPDKNLFPDKPEGWKDGDIIMLAITWSDIKTVGSIVMHKYEAKEVADAIMKVYRTDYRSSSEFIETMTREFSGH